MCTATTYQTACFYFGRTLDYDCSYGEEVAVTPRHFPLRYREAEDMPEHYAIIGMAHVANGYPLYYDGCNERGLCMAGLNFVGNAVYRSAPEAGRVNIAQFEFIPYILGSCATLSQAREALAGLCLRDTPFCEQMPVAQLHWIIADKTGCITVESREGGLCVYENPAGVLTNNPPFPQQLEGLESYRGLSPQAQTGTFGGVLPPTPDSRGTGALGLPGDWTSKSRFVRAAYVRQSSVSGEDEAASVGQFFHMLEAVSIPRGCCDEQGRRQYHHTLYSSCCNADRGIYYYTTYGNRQITAVDLHRAGGDGQSLCRYPLFAEENIRRQN